MTFKPSSPGRRRRRTRIALVSTLCAGLTMGLLAACQEQPEESSEAAVPNLAWEDCEDGFECATAEVPLDYDDPGGEQIELALIRLPASNPDERIGSMFTNPGGPGLPGVSYLRDTAALFPEQLREQFDLIGLDPRGVSQSTPVQCFDSVEEQVAFAAENRLWPTEESEVDAFAESQRDRAEHCADGAGELLDHTSTANVARDLDLLREAGGDDQLTFFGNSYGSYLGATYAAMFPDRVRAMALDGATDPDGYAGTDADDASTPWLRSNAHLGATETLDQFLELCGEAAEHCPFGADGDPHEKFAALVDRLTDAPLLIDNGTDAPTELGVDIVLVTVLNGLYHPALWSGVGAALQDYQEMADQPADTVHPAPEDGGAAPDTEAGAEYNNVQDAQFAVICADTDQPDIEGIAEAAELARPDAPYTADRWSWAISGPCPYWGGPDEDRYTGPFGAETEHPLLVVGTRFDPATPHQNAERLSGDLPNAGLLTLEGWGHTAAFQAVSACIDAAVAEYLITQELPPEEGPCASPMPPASRSRPRRRNERPVSLGVGRPPPPSRTRSGPGRRGVRGRGASRTRTIDKVSRPRLEVP